MKKILLILFIVSVIFMFMMNIFNTAESSINSSQRKYQDMIISHFHANEDILDFLKNYFLKNFDIFLSSSFRSHDKHGIEIVNFETRERVNIEDHELINLLSEKEIKNVIFSYLDTTKTTCRYSQISAVDNNFVRFIFNFGENIELIYSSNGEIIGNDLIYYPHRREYWINDNWYIQYFYESRGIFEAR